MERNEIMTNVNLETVQSQVSQFDKMKFIDEDGKEKISGRELAKALGYTDWRNFKKAVARTNEQIKNVGKSEEAMIGEVTTHREVKHSGSSKGVEYRKISDYHLTRKQAINVANNADTSKQEVAMVQEYLYDTSEMGEKAINICNKLKDRAYIENRSAVSEANRNLSGNLLFHGTDEKDLGVVHNEADKRLYDMTTQEIKDEYGKGNRPKADFLGSMMCSAEAFAKNLSSVALDAQGAVGLKECKEIVGDVHGKVRSQIIQTTGKKPEELITGEDVKLVEKRYKKLTKEQLKAIEQEF